MALGRIPLGLLTIILLVLPGLLALDIYFRVSKKSRSYSRIKWIGYSTGVSLASLLVLYSTSPLYFSGLASWAPEFEQTVGLVTRSQMKGSSGLETISLYLLHVGIATVLGTSAGVLDRFGLNRNSPPRDRREPWSYAFNQIPADGETIEVVVNDGTIIQGDFNRTAWDDSQRELFLDDPYQVEYFDNGATIKDRQDLGRSMLLKEETISRVVFIEEDPDTTTINQIEEELEFDDSFSKLVESVDDLLEDMVISEQVERSVDESVEEELEPEKVREILDHPDADEDYNGDNSGESRENEGTEEDN